MSNLSTYFLNSTPRRRDAYFQDIYDKASIIAKNKAAQKQQQSFAADEIATELESLLNADNDDDFAELYELVFNWKPVTRHPQKQSKCAAVQTVLMAILHYTTDAAKLNKKIVEDRNVNIIGALILNCQWYYAYLELQSIPSTDELTALPCYSQITENKKTAIKTFQSILTSDLTATEKLKKVREFINNEGGLNALKKHDNIRDRVGELFLQIISFMLSPIGFPQWKNKFQEIISPLESNEHTFSSRKEI